MKHSIPVYFFLLFAAIALPVLAGVAYGQSTHSFNSGMNCGVWYLTDTGATNCSDTWGNVRSCAGTGEDGDHNPAAIQPSYTIISNLGVAGSSVTVDNVTGLMWITNPRTDAAMGGYYANMEDGITACEAKNYAGFSDWRLPNALELLSIVDYSALNPPINTTYFPGTYSGPYLVSTTYMPYNNYDYWVIFSGGKLEPNNSYSSSNYIRCVRGGL